MRLELTVNGERRGAGRACGRARRCSCAARAPGTSWYRNACEQGECGSCSVYMDGTLVCSCLVLAGQAEEREIVTVEGLAGRTDCTRCSRHSSKRGVCRCRFCTPAIVATHDLLQKEPRAERRAGEEALAGNLCRCTGYEKILDAVRLASRWSDA